jgi:recombination protein RecR
MCSICLKTSRDDTIICVVSCIQDLMAIESSGSFSGSYHVLHGVLEPMNGIGPKDLRLQELLKRIFKQNIKELILATPSTVEGEATALYILQQINHEAGVKVSRIASGVPVGGELQFADRLSLARAMMMRQNLDN